MKVLFTSLGCDKNLVDTEMMLKLLEEKGFGFTDDEEEADAVIVNTCCFIGDARRRASIPSWNLLNGKRQGS